MTQFSTLLAAHPLLASLGFATLITFIAIPFVVSKIKTQRENLRNRQDEQHLLDWIGGDAYVHLPMNFEPATTPIETKP